jgi:CBS domain-containing protein
MADEDISSLVVVDDDGYLLGILSRTDLLRAHRAGGPWALQPVSKCMTQPVVAVTPVDRLSHVADLLLDKQIHRVVVVREENGKQRPVAVISDADLVYHMTREA